MELGEIFSDGELSEMTVAELRRVLRYLQLPYASDDKRAALVQKIKSFQTQFLPPQEVEVPKYSVRVKRIMEGKVK